MAKTIHRSEYQLIRDMIRQARESAGMTQIELSKLLERSQTFVSNLEQSDRRIDVLELREVCGLLGQDFIAFLKDFESRVHKSPSKRKASGKR